MAPQSGKTNANERNVLPRVGATILAQAFVVKAVHLSHLAALVVAAKQSNAFGIPGLVRQQKLQGFDAVMPAVDVIAHEHVVVAGNGAALLKQVQQIKELPVDVAANDSLAHARTQLIRQGRHTRCHQKRANESERAKKSERTASRTGLLTGCTFDSSIKISFT